MIKSEAHYRWERLFGQLGLHLLLLVVVTMYILPPVMVILYSFKERVEMLKSGPLELPESFYLGNYQEAFVKLDFLRSMYNSALITAVSVGVALLLASLAAYGIARGRGRRFTFLYLVFVGGLLIPYQAIFVPIYLLGSALNLVNTYIGVILFYIAGQLPFSVFMMTGFMKTVPMELEQAAQIDGCGKLRVFFQIVFPLLKPVLITLAVLRALIVWNDYLLPKMFLQRRELQTLVVRISTLFGQYRYELSLAFAAIVISSIPILLFFLYNQKKLEKGITIGALKG